MEFSHKSVLLNECIENLNIKPDGIYVDGTLGGAGHSYHICERLSKKGRLIGIDQDEDAIRAATTRLEPFKDRVTIVKDNYSNIKNVLVSLGIDKVDGILLDIGVSSYQLDNAERGFTYKEEDAPLDMRMDRQSGITAQDVVNDYSEMELFRVIRDYGEEQFAKNIAKHICIERSKSRITTTGRLTEIIKAAIPMKFRVNGGHPAKKTFQAIRIEANNEIEPLHKTVIKSINCLKSGGRLCIITFHSLEDRAVKNAYQDAMGKCTCPPGLPYCVCGKKTLGKIITKKPILPTEEEMKANSRSKSAKLRVFERI